MYFLPHRQLYEFANFLSNFLALRKATDAPPLIQIYTGLYIIRKNFCIKASK